MTRIEYVTHLKSKKWKALRRRRLKQDGKQCTSCFSTENLTVHHLTYERFGHEDLNDIITLCIDCHNKVHNRQPKGKHNAKHH